MKPRHQSSAERRPRQASKPHRDVSFQIVGRAPLESIEPTTSLKNIELQSTSRGQFLVFRTADGERFAMNLDCQEEFGFEAKMLLEKWAQEQSAEVTAS